jgi:hypothetical protein
MLQRLAGGFAADRQGVPRQLHFPRAFPEIVAGSRDADPRSHAPGQTGLVGSRAAARCRPSTRGLCSPRVTLALATTLGLLAAPLAAEAQTTGKVWRIGWLSPPSAATGVSELDALREGLRELNYVEGRNITIEARWADGDPARLPDLARALVELNVDIICTAGTPATLAAKQATTTIPIVFGRAAFPERTDLVASLRPAGWQT